MKIGKFLLGIGKGLIKELPGGELALTAINAFLPEDKKLPVNATGDQAVDAVNSLPPEQRSSLMEKKLDVEIAGINSWTSIQDSLRKADQAGASTRPKIALMMAYIVCFSIVTFLLIWGYSICTDKQKIVKTLNDSWPLVTAILATPTVLLRAYFGMRTKEKQGRYQAASGQPRTDIVSQLIGVFKK